ncbi:MAG: glycosyltransferase [Puniceicoccaceae bacterium]
MRYLIICGGTGGHLSPGLATAAALRERQGECRLVVSHRKVDTVLLQKYPELEFEAVPGAALSMRPDRFLRSFPAHLGNLRASLRLVRSFKPQVILAFGGYLSLGAVVASFVRGPALALHEANRIPGKAIRILSRFADRVYLPEGVDLGGRMGKKIRSCGYPVRSEFRVLDQGMARRKLGIPVEGRLLVVLGGSQGAQALNDWAHRYRRALGERGIHLVVVCGLGKIRGEETQPGEAATRTTLFRQIEFSDQMEYLLNAADLVVSRAGAGTLAELVRCQTPAILIPYPHAADGHQEANAIDHVAHGGGNWYREGQEEEIFARVSELLEGGEELRGMKERLRLRDARNSDESFLIDLEAMAMERAKQKGRPA